MAYAFLHFGGGGSSESLNFTVIGGTSQPATASENTIWVNTDATITGYTISATAPEEPTDGMVWITPGASGEAVVTVTKKNPIKVYPISAKQHFGGSWVDVTAKNWQNGEWVDWWNGELYKDGDEYTDYTGGWIKGEVNGNATTTENADSIELNTTAGTRIHVETNEKVEFGKYKNLIIVFDVINSASITNVVRLGYSTNKATNLANATTKVEDVLGKGTTGERSLSISLDGAPESAYVVVGVGVTGTVIKLKKVQMTK